MKYLSLILLLFIVILTYGCKDDPAKPIPLPDMNIKSGTYAATEWINVEEDNMHATKEYLVASGSKITKEVRYFSRERITSDWQHDRTESVGSATMKDVGPFCITEGFEITKGYVTLVDFTDFNMYLTYAERYTGGPELTSTEWVNTEMYNYNTDDFPAGTIGTVIKFNTDNTGYVGLRMQDESTVQSDTFTYDLAETLIFITFSGGEIGFPRFYIEGDVMYFSVPGSKEYLILSD